MKSEKHVFVLTPRLSATTFRELKKCGDPSSKEPVLGVRRHGGQPDKKEALAKQLNIPEETIENNAGRGSSTRKD
jgi:hypothetical protein